MIRLPHHSNPSQAKPAFAWSSWHQARFFFAVLTHRTICTALSAPQEEIAPGTQVRNALAATGDGNQCGSIVVIILIMMLFLTTMLFGAISLANENLNRAWQRLMLLQAQYAAESGADYAITELNNYSSSYTGTGGSEIQVLSTLSTLTSYKATFTVSVATSGSNEVITSTGKVYRPKTASAATYTRKIQVTAQRTAGSTASGMMSTNVIDVDSSVKNIYGNSIFLNGFFKIRSNSTTVHFSSLTVGNKDNASNGANCSVEGSGALANNPSTSKAAIDMAYNNCITPPGNTSNSNFTVTANDSGITKIQSLNIPWNQYMDNSYQNSPTGCADWTASSPATIPSTGNTKKTHYPDTGSGVASSCGTSGDLSLGSKTFNIADNVHVRANFCKTTACNPTFNNTSGSLKFIFVEGSINFSAVQTAAGSSPLVIVSYAADPGTHNSNQCPYGDAIYLNKNGSTGTNAPQLYLIAINDMCLNQTKFDASPGLAGLGAKNLYISSNSGNPFDLYLNTSFPDSSIPINLAWRATGYERL